MIEINLLPERLRKKRGPIKFKTLALPKEVLFGLLGGLICFLVIIHFILLSFTIFKKIQFSGLSKQWQSVLPQKQEVDHLKQEISLTDARIKSLVSLQAHRRISWSEKLNRISDDMARGLWLTRIYFGEGILKIEGSAVSQKGEEMINVGKFTTNLKEDKDFFKGIENIELTVLQRRNIKSIEVVDFIITTAVKE